MAAGARPAWLHPHRLPSAAREQVHLEEGVSGRDGEVRKSCSDGRDDPMPNPS